MIEQTLHIFFLSDWHCGSGLGESHLADAVLNRDSNGIPVIHGRAVKGALREGAWRLSSLGEDYARLMNILWGNAPDGGTNHPGKIYVGSAQLPADIKEYLCDLDYEERNKQISFMTINRARTALKNGVAKTRSLRTVECGLPGLEFISHIGLDVPESESDWLIPYMHAVCAAVKSIGADRARGLGRCVVRMGEYDVIPTLPDIDGRVERIQ